MFCTFYHSLILNEVTLFQHPEIFDPLLQSMDEITNAVLKNYHTICSSEGECKLRAYNDLEVSIIS